MIVAKTYKYSPWDLVIQFHVSTLCVLNVSNPELLSDRTRIFAIKLL